MESTEKKVTHGGRKPERERKERVSVCPSGQLSTYEMNKNTSIIFVGTVCPGRGETTVQHTRA